MKGVRIMKCHICKNKTTWDESYGYESFIVCPKCHEAIKNKLKKDNIETMKIIFALGDIARENNIKGR